MNCLTRNLRPCLAAVALAGLSLLAFGAQAQAYPTKLVRIVVSFASGGAGDLVARLAQQKLQEQYGQSVIVENRPGGSGAIGAELVAKSAPDGHTLLITNQLIVQAPHLFARPTYDALRDFVPVAELAGAPPILAVNTAKTNARTLKDFVEEVKKNPRTFSYASVGQGSMGHLYGAALNEAAGIDLMHVPYKGSAPVVMALVGGEVQSAFSDYATMKPYIESGKLRLLAVSKQYAPTPNVPTFASLGYPNLTSYSWIGMFAPAGTPNAIVQQLAADIARITRLPDVAAKLTDLGLDTGGMPQEQFAAMVAADSKRWAEIIRKAGIKAE
ncbi:MAG TPA: tripartite tricarboxylate transporter substrate binding protein [Ramlibacter sp.]|nr:tripartite tricarboxylate transporter substrate binding protein [Ramlibacter sp.]